MKMTKAREKAPVFVMKPSVSKIVEALLFLMHAASGRHMTITQYEAVKALFFADESHLNAHGRPITFDNYKALPYGPVPILAYEILMEKPSAIKKIGCALPWSRSVQSVSEKSIIYHYNSPARAVDEDTLSESDREHLTQAFHEVKALGWSDVYKKTHAHPAYIDAWEDESGAKQFPMSYSLLFRDRNDSAAADLSFLSEHV